MESKDDRGSLWLHLICCGGLLIVIAIVSLAPALIAFVVTPMGRVLVLVAGVSVALVAALIWWRRQCATRLNSPGQLDRVDPARRQQ